MFKASVTGQKFAPRLRVAYNPEFDAMSSETLPFTPGQVLAVVGVHVLDENAPTNHASRDLSDDHLNSITAAQFFETVAEKVVEPAELNEFVSDIEPNGIAVYFDLLDEFGGVHFRVPDYCFVPVWGLNSLK